MQQEVSARPNRFVDLARAHAEDFEKRVAQHDAENSFPHENIDAMKASGYTAMIAPAELGGGGARPSDVARAQEQLGYGDLPTAIAINMHLIAVALISDLWQLGKAGQGLELDAIEPMLKSIVDDQIIFAGPLSDPGMNSSFSYGGVIDTTRRAEKVEGGYRISGRSGFGTLSACADYYLTSARYDHPEHGPQCLLCFLPSNSEGVQVQDTWDTMAIRSSLSNDIVWDNVFIPEAAAVPRPVQVWDAVCNVSASWWVVSGPACYIGLAQAARDFAVNWVAERCEQPFHQPMTHYPGHQILAADMEIGLRSARALLQQTAAQLDDLELRCQENLVELISCNQFVMESCLEVVDKAMRMVGGAALFKRFPMERMYRDARAAVIHQPFAGTDGKTLLGRRAFGLPLDLTPRYV